MEFVQSVTAAPSGQRYRCQRLLRLRQRKRASQQSHASESLPVPQPQETKSHSQRSLLCLLSANSETYARTGKIKGPPFGGPSNSVLFFLGCRATGFLLLFLFAASLGASFLTVATPLVTPLHPLRLRISICCRQHRRWNCKAHRGGQAQKRESRSTRHRLQFHSFTHSNLLALRVLTSMGTRRPIVGFDISQRYAKFFARRLAIPVYCAESARTGAFTCDARDPYALHHLAGMTECRRHVRFPFGVDHEIARDRHRVAPG